MPIAFAELPPAAPRRGGNPRRKLSRQSAFCHKAWDTEDEFSCFVDYAGVPENSLRQILQERLSKPALERLTTMKQLTAAAKRLRVHEERLRGSDALR